MILSNMKQLYFLHAESDEILIGDENWNDVVLDCIGEVKRRTLSEVKSLLQPEHWVFQLYTDERLIKELNLIHEISIYTDGSGNNKTLMNGGCGVVLLYKHFKAKHAIGQFVNVTTAQMELKGVIEGLRLVTDKSIPTVLYCDNQYAVFSITKGWAENWERNNFLYPNPKKPSEIIPRPNADLIKQLLVEVRKFPEGNLQFVWIRGHDGNEWNEVADKLAAEGAHSKTILQL